MRRKPHTTYLISSCDLAHGPWPKMWTLPPFSTIRSDAIDYNDPDTFELFLYWLYHESLPAEVEGGEDDPNAQHTLHRIIRLWSFAEKYTIPRLQNEAMNIVFECFGSGAAEANIETIRLVDGLVNKDSELSKAIFKHVMHEMSYGGYSSVELQELAAMPGLLQKALWTVGAGGDGINEECAVDYYVAERPSRASSVAVSDY